MPKKLPAFDVPVLEVIVLLPVNAVLNVADESVSKRTSSLPSVPKYRLPVEAMVELAELRVIFPPNVAWLDESNSNAVALAA